MSSAIEDPIRQVETPNGREAVIYDRAKILQYRKKDDAGHWYLLDLSIRKNLIRARRIIGW